ncbi:MAG: hypothetical protein M1334_03610 [Patescibacteria group bacterium]|nr:hypothetical protein [Patescibacteria group bacterium]
MMRYNVENAVLNQREGEEFGEEIKELNDKLKKEIQIEAEMLKKSNFPVDDECRIDMDKFEGIYSHDIVSRNKGVVVSREDSFKNKNKKENEFVDPVGELLEKSKTLSVNHQWLKGRYLALRTSKFDDYQNGVDELIINVETSEVIAAVDSTTDFMSKAETGKINKILKEGADVTYGLKIRDNKPVLGELAGLPVFIISFKKKETIELAKKVADQINPEEEGKKLLDSLIKQAEMFSRSASSKMRPKYEKALKEFQDLKKDM